MSRFAIRSSLAALGLVVAATGLAGGAIAAPGADTSWTHAAQHEGKRGDHHRHDHKHGDRRGGSEWRDAYMVPGVGPLSKKQVESLKLDDKQQAAFDSAKNAQKAMFGEMKAKGGKRHEMLDKQISDGKLDPRALIAQHDEQRAVWHKQSQDVRDQWLAAWDSLTPAQQKQVLDDVKDRQEKKQAHREKRQERHDKQRADRAENSSSDTAVTN